MPGTTTFTKATKEFFGLKDGETLTEFVGELKQLTPEDKAEMAPQLAEALGVDEVTF